MVLATGIPILGGEDMDVEETVVKAEVDAEQKTCEQNGQTDVDMVAVRYERSMNWLRGQLETYGEIKYINMPRYKSTGEIRGFAFVEFARKKAANLAAAALAPMASDLVACIARTAEVGRNGKKVVRESGEMKSAEAGWMPKTAPFVTVPQLSMEECLARQFVWRCCSRRSKQACGAYRRLLAAGYRLPNPLEAEYRLITEGIGRSVSDEIGEVDAVTEEKRMDVETEARTGLRLLPYSDWLTWRSRFYTWQRAWIQRMQKKTTQLMARSERKRLLAHPASTAVNSPVAVVTAPVVSAEENKSTAVADEVSLPANYCQGSVVEVYWPLDVELREMEARQQMRRVRATIEHKLLQPHSLLHSVVHFDTQMSSCESLPRIALPGSDGSTRRVTDTLSSSTTARVFVRFRGSLEAQAFADLCECSGTADSTELVESMMPRAIVLEGSRERAYCAAIAAAKAGGAERRRRAQAAKRRRKSNKPQLQPKGDDGEEEETENERGERLQPVKSSHLRKLPDPMVVGAKTEVARPKRIVFDDE